ncbi:hypothetical protein KUH03_27270 [Sphingobacterium sp. E70]|uniref:hypothetical protein n=1 Tax=Sphingobacterium sp. E70 TaxID=2853439 RepID=UPI00211C3EBB|nr:hypothetical protein [Sphingobacterium sp. E70]ULT22948.1 hypothetical protein KUH03_27270 [Sphingobacterium sp. E70]
MVYLGVSLGSYKKDSDYRLGEPPHSNIRQQNSKDNMELFGNLFDGNKNILPYDGTVNYYGKILDPQQADHYFNLLMNSIEWVNDRAIIFGNEIITKRKVAWYGDQAFEYSYSNTTKRALPGQKNYSN